MSSIYTPILKSAIPLADPVSVIAFSQPTFSINENGVPVTQITLTRTGSSTGSASVTLTSTDGTATKGSDYVSNPLVVTFANGETIKTVTIPIINDTLIDGNETVNLKITNPTFGAILGTQSTATLKIIDDDAPTTRAWTPVTNGGFESGDLSGWSPLNNQGNFSISSDRSVFGDFSVKATTSYDFSGPGYGLLKTIDGLTAGQKYVLSGFIYTGESTSGSTYLDLNDIPEDPQPGAGLLNGVNEWQFVWREFVAPSNQVLVRIVRDGENVKAGESVYVDEVAITPFNQFAPAISISNITIVEGKDANAVLTVTLNRPSPQATTIDYSTKNRTALAGSDYTTTTGKLTFAANEISKTITIPILNNDLNEANETFEINLSNPVNGTLAKNQAIVTISDTLSASVTTTLTAQVENLTLTGTAAINGTGNANGNVLTGNSADNTLVGLGGDDTYKFVANSSLGTDTITETTTGGKDSLDLSGTNDQVRVNLGSISNQTVVTGKLLLKLSATDVIENAIGGNGGDRLIGNALNNSLNGNTGKDTLTGANGADTLTGGAGDDFLSGGADSDSFFYGTEKAFATADIGLDTLTDFAPTTDKLSLSKTTFNALTSVVGNGFSQATDFAVVEDDALVGSSSAFIVYNSNSGSLFYNQNGSLAGLGTGAEFSLLLGTPSLTANSFALVL